MQMSLKEARRVERRIENVVNLPIELNSVINIYEDLAVETVVSTARETTINTVMNTVELINSRAYIRRSIQEANEHSGINTLIADRECLLRESTIWEMVNNAGKYRQSVQALRKMVDGMQDNTQTAISSYGRHNTIPFNAVSESLSDESTKNMYKNRLAIDKIDDQIASKNAKTTIEIPGNLITFLKEQNII